MEKNYSRFKRQRRHVNYLVKHAKKQQLILRKLCPAKLTTLGWLVWKALNALTKNAFSCKQNIPSTLTAVVFNYHFLSLVETLTKTLPWGGGGGGEGEQYQCSDELKKFCSKRLKFEDITFISPEITSYEVGKYVSSVSSKKYPWLWWN